MTRSTLLSRLPTCAHQLSTSKVELVSRSKVSCDTRSFLDYHAEPGVTEYAGNIIPAIATTNAIIAGVLVLQALNVLRSTWSQAKMVWLSRQPNKILSLSQLPQPNSQCSICRAVYLPISYKPGAFTLGQFVDQVVVDKVGFNGHVIVREGSRVLFETEDFEDNKDKTFEDMGLTEGVFLTVLDDDEPHYPVQFSIGCVRAREW